MHISSGQVSYVMPKHFEENIVRVYSKRDGEGDTREQVKEAVKLAFRRYLKRHSLKNHLHSPVLGGTPGPARGAAGSSNWLEQSDSEDELGAGVRSNGTKSFETRRNSGGRLGKRKRGEESED